MANKHRPRCLLVPFGSRVCDCVGCIQINSFVLDVTAGVFCVISCPAVRRRRRSQACCTHQSQAKTRQFPAQSFLALIRIRIRERLQNASSPELLYYGR